MSSFDAASELRRTHTQLQGSPSARGGAPSTTHQRSNHGPGSPLSPYAAVGATNNGNNNNATNGNNASNKAHRKYSSNSNGNTKAHTSIQVSDKLSDRQHLLDRQQQQHLQAEDGIAAGLQRSPSGDLSSAESTVSSHASDSKDHIQPRHPNHLYHWLAFFTLGTINNFGFVVVQSAARSLAGEFNAMHLFGVVQWANCALGIVARLFNAFFLLHLSAQYRINLTTCIAVIGFLGLSFSIFVNFWFAILSIVMIGVACSLGESVILGYLKGFNISMMGAWSSGTGLAGLGGSMAYLIMYSMMNLSNTVIFFALTPLNFIYWGAFLYICHQTAVPNTPDTTGLPTTASNSHHQRQQVPQEEQQELLNNQSTLKSSNHEMTSLNVETVSPNGDTAIGQPMDSLSSDLLPPRVESTRTRTLRVFRLVQSKSIQLALVYFFEYSAGYGFANISAEKYKQHLHGDNSWAHLNAYEILCFCYQLGVLISRSSIGVIQIQRIWILTALQALNFIIWWFQAISPSPYFPLWLQFGHMVFIGLLGGAMYVNTFSLLVKDTSIPSLDQELAINIVAIFVTFGVVASSVFEIVMDNTMLKV